jgi:hypothetical protein
VAENLTKEDFTMSYEEQLKTEANEAGVADKAEGKKKERTKTAAEPKQFPQFNEDGTPQLDDQGQQVWGAEKSAFKKGKTPKAPKVVVYELNEDGTQKLDEAGNPIPVKKVRAPKLDADGNPIARNSNVYLDSQVLQITEAGTKVSYQPESKRGKIFASIKDGMTVKEFYDLNGGKKVAHTFLVWYANEAKVVEVKMADAA